MDNIQELAKQFNDYLTFTEVSLNITTGEKFKVNYKQTETAHRWTITKEGKTTFYNTSYNYKSPNIRDYVICKITLPIIEDSEFVLKISHDKGVQPANRKNPQEVCELIESYISRKAV